LHPSPGAWRAQASKKSCDDDPDDLALHRILRRRRLVGAIDHLKNGFGQLLFGYRWLLPESQQVETLGQSDTRRKVQGLLTGKLSAGERNRCHVKKKAGNFLIDRFDSFALVSGRRDTRNEAERVFGG